MAAEPSRFMGNALMQRVMNATTVARTRLAKAIGITHDNERDLWEVFGYPRTIQIATLYERYKRGGIESRIIRSFSKATWRQPPHITDDSDSDTETEFERAVKQLDRDFMVWHMLERADRLSTIGRFGTLFMGFNDGRRPQEPLRMGGQQKLLWLRPFSERSVSISAFVRDPQDPRFGLPASYTIDTVGLENRQTYELGVHHSRMMHLVEQAEEDEIYGTPRLEAVYNRLLDLEKVCGGSAEAFWLNANSMLALMAQADANLTSDDIDNLKNQAEEFQHQLRRMMAVQGVDVKQMQQNIADPSNHMDKIMEQIAGTIGIPKRILVGSERGELASSSDDDNWASVIEERRETYVVPQIVRPFIDKMIETGNLPEPQGGEYEAGWEPHDNISEPSKAEIAQKRANALATYANAPIAESIVPAREFREQFLGLDPEPDGGFPEDVEPDTAGNIDPDETDDLDDDLDDEEDQDRA